MRGTLKQGEVIKSQFFGSIKDYLVIVTPKYDCIDILKKNKVVAHEMVKGLGEFVTHAGKLRLGWIKQESGDEVISIYDKSDENFGYHVNIDSPQCSEWGYAYFGE